MMEKVLTNLLLATLLIGCTNSPKSKNSETEKTMEFKFNEKRNVAVVTLKQILHSNKPILLVSHSIEDGGWQFLSGEAVSMGDVMLVGLETIVKHDQSINELFDLPEGWEATRKSIGGKWERRHQHE